MKNLICFGLEGPLSSQDNAYEVSGLMKDGHKLFEILSKYDDILTLEKKENYEPGTTLSLIVPFLIYYNISESDVLKVSKRAKLVSGAKELISSLKKEDWEVVIVTSAYEQHAYNIAEKLGVEKENVACTKLPLDSYEKKILQDDRNFLKKSIKHILEELYPIENEELLKEYLDKFFWEQLPSRDIGRFLNEVEPHGGYKKSTALENFAEQNNIGMNRVVAVGDSITDYKMLTAVREAGGISIVFNGNKYAVPYASFGVASTKLNDIKVLLDAFSESRKKLIEIIKGLESKNIPDKLPYYNYLEGAELNKIDHIIKVHAKARNLLRGKAAKLG